MGLVWLRWRAEMRARWRATVVMVVVVGIGAGVALAALAGARRSDTAMPEFVAYSRPDDGGFIVGGTAAPPPAPGAAVGSLALPALQRRVVDLPQVAAYFRAPHLFVTTDPTGRHDANTSVIGAANADLFRTVDRPLVVAGHLPDPTSPFDAVINELAAHQSHLHVGSIVHLYAYSAAQFQGGALTGGVELQSPPAGPRFTVRVVAVVRSPQDVNAVVPLLAHQHVSYEGDQNIYVTPAFLSRLAAGLGVPVQGLSEINFFGVRLRHGAADWQAFVAGAHAIGHSQIFTSAGNVYNIRTAASSAERGIHLEVVALLLFAAFAALVTLLLVGQSIARQVMLEGDDYATLRCLGARRVQLVAVVALRATVVGVGGGILAFMVAVAGSPLMPLGLARQAEIHPGFDVDVVVLIPGFLVMAVLIVARSLWPGWWVSRRPLTSAGDGMSDARLSRLAGAVARTTLSPVPSIGVRYGLESGRGRRAVPLVSALVGAVVAVTALAAVLTFGTSLDHLLGSPRQQGWNWDVLVGNPNSTTDQEAPGAALLARNRNVAAYSSVAILAGAEQGNVVIDGKVVDLLLAFDPLKGSVYPPVVQGHAPRAGDQVVLASKTLEQLHRHIGQSIEVAGPAGQPRTLHIVGSMISPSVGDLFTNGMGDGGWVYGPAVRQALAAAPPTTGGAPATVFTLFAVRYARGVSPAMAYASVRRDFGATVLRHLPSEDVLNLQSVDRLPPLLAVLVVLLGVASVGNTLVASVRQRRRELAILKTIGFVNRQVAAVVAWQATSFCVVALVVGIPLGVVGGRWAWHLVASGIGSVSPAVVPALWIVGVVPAALAVANVIAAWPGWVAAKVSPAVVMRNE